MDPRGSRSIAKTRAWYVLFIQLERNNTPASNTARQLLPNCDDLIAIPCLERYGDVFVMHDSQAKKTRRDTLPTIRH